MIRALPPVRTHATRSLEEALAHRRSARDYQSVDLSPQQIAQLLWAAQGVTSPAGYRTAPSAGALYPLELYVATAEGMDRYEPRGHALERRRTDDVRSSMRAAALDQASITAAPAVFIFAAVYERTRREYGKRAERYVHMDVGHAAQNLLLQADAMGLAGVPIAAFDDDDLHAALGLPAAEIPVYLVPVGRPLASS